MSSVEWYVRIDDRELGPISATQLQQLAQAGSLHPDDLVRKGRAGDWIQAERLRGLTFAATQAADSNQTATATPDVPRSSVANDATPIHASAFHLTDSRLKVREPEDAAKQPGNMACGLRKAHRPLRHWTMRWRPKAQASS
jgi:hypothetical protein